MASVKKLYMKRIKQGLLMLLLLLVCITEMASCSADAPAIGDTATEASDDSWMDYTRLSNDETAEFIKRDDVIVIDVRKPEQYEAGHLKGAVNIYYDRFMDGRIEELPDLDQPILVYCDYGGLSGIVGDELVAQGYTEVYDFDGLDYWDGEVVTGSAPG